VPFWFGDRCRFNRSSGLDKSFGTSINQARTTSAFVASPWDGRQIMETIKGPAISPEQSGSGAEQAANRKPIGLI
jgi:hypothetical protein